MLQVLVWHTRTEPAVIKNEDKMPANGYEQSDPNVEVWHHLTGWTGSCLTIIGAQVLTSVAWGGIPQKTSYYLIGKTTLAVMF